MKALILAAGRGSRMGSLTDNLPKCYTVFREKTLLEWQIEALRGAGIENIALVRGYLADCFQYDLQYYENRQWASSNMVRSLLCASEWIEAEGSIVSYSDIVYSRDSVQTLLSGEGDIVMTYDPNWLSLWKIRFKDVLDDAETFRVDTNSNILEIGNRPQTIKEVEGQYMGLLYFSKKGWEKILDILSRFQDDFIDRLDITKLLQLLLASKVAIRAVPITERWFEFDSISDLLAYEASISGQENIFTI